MSDLSQLIWHLVYNTGKVTFLSGCDSDFQQEINRGRGLLGLCKRDVVGRGSAHELLSLSFSIIMLNNSSCRCGCRGQAWEQDGDSDLKSCAAVQYLWPGILLLCTAWEPDAPTKETSVISQPLLFDTQNEDDRPAGLLRCYTDGFSLKSVNILLH